MTLPLIHWRNHEVISAYYDNLRGFACYIIYNNLMKNDKFLSTNIDYVHIIVQKIEYSIALDNIIMNEGKKTIIINTDNYKKFFSISFEKYASYFIKFLMNSLSDDFLKFFENNDELSEMYNILNFYRSLRDENDIFHLENCYGFCGNINCFTFSKNYSHYLKCSDMNCLLCIYKNLFIEYRRFLETSNFEKKQRIKNNELQNYVNIIYNKHAKRDLTKTRNIFKKLNIMRPTMYNILIEESYLHYFSLLNDINYILDKNEDNFNKKLKLDPFLTI